MIFLRRAFQDEVLRRRRALEGLAVVLLAFAVYAPTLGYGFVWDDRLLVLENESIRDWSSLPRALVSDFFFAIEEGGGYGYHRPLITLSYMVDHALWGLRPAGFHLTNLLLHAASTLLVYLLAGRLVGGGPAALLAAALFAVHPVHTESVAWIAGRTDVVATTFVLLSFFLYVRARGRWGALVAFVLALAGKEVAAVYPALLLLYEGLFGPPGWRERLRRVLPFLVALAAFLLFRFAVLGIAPANPHLAEQGRYRLLLTFAEALWIYGGKLLVPVNLSAYYSMPVAGSVAEFPVLVSLLGLAGLAAAVWALHRRQPAIVFSLVFVPVALLPVSNLVSIAGPRDMGFVMAERYLYLPSVGFCLFLAALLVRASLRCRDRAGRIAVGALALVLVALGAGATAGRNRVWRDEVTFYQKTLESAPLAPLLHFNLGNRYLDLGQIDLAEREWREAIRPAPGRDGLAAAHGNLGQLLFRRGQVDEAMAHWAAALQVDPHDAMTHHNMGRALDAAGRLEEASDSYRRFLRSAPKKYASRRPAIQARLDEIQAQLDRVEGAGRRRFRLGVRYQEAGLLDLAEREWREAIRLEPGLSEAHNNLGNALFVRGQVDEAMAEWAMAVKADPANAGAHYNLGRALDAAGRRDEARDAYRRFLETAPEQHASARRAIEARLNQIEGRR